MISCENTVFMSHIFIFLPVSMLNNKLIVFVSQPRCNSDVTYTQRFFSWPNQEHCSYPNATKRASYRRFPLLQSSFILNTHLRFIIFIFVFSVQYYIPNFLLIELISLSTTSFPFFQFFYFFFLFNIFLLTPYYLEFLLSTHTCAISSIDSFIS